MALDAPTCLAHTTRDGERIAEAAEGHLDDPVLTCPGNTVGSLLLHIAGACRFFGTASNLLLFLWGRVPSAALAVMGDASLLERRQERVKI